MNSRQETSLYPRFSAGLMLLSAVLLASVNARANDFHPGFPLLDQAGQTVVGYAGGKRAHQPEFAGRRHSRSRSQNLAL